MKLLKKYRLIIIAVLVVVVVAVLGLSFLNRHAPVAEDAPSEFQSDNFSVTYPRLYTAKEYSKGVVLLGGMSDKLFIPLITISHFKGDPDSPAKSFDAFVTRQLQALCGSDSGVSLTCTTPVMKPYTALSGFVGKEVTMTLVKKDLKTGVATNSTYGPIYVFDTTAPAEAGEATRYQGVFVYPTFSSFVLAPTSGELVAAIADTLKITSGSSQKVTPKP